MHDQETETWVKIGKFKAAHGLKGQLYFLLFSGHLDWLGAKKTITIKYGQHTQVIKSFKPYKQGLLINIPDVNDRNGSESLLGEEVFIPSHYLVSQPGEQFFLHEVKGFQVLDRTLGLLGTVNGFSSNGAQDLLLVDHERQRLEIPFIEEFTDKIDFLNNKIKVQVPAGLIEFRYEI